MFALHSLLFPAERPKTASGLVKKRARMTTSVDYEVDATLIWLATLAARRDATAAPLLRVALQWPDALLSDALAVEAELKAGAAARGLEAEVRHSDARHACISSVCPRDNARRAEWRERAPAFRPRMRAAAFARSPSQPPLHPLSKFFLVADSTFNPAALDEVTAIDHGRADVAVHYGPASLADPTRLPVRFVFGRRGGVDPAGLAAAVSAHAASLAPPPPAVVLVLDQALDWAADDVQAELDKRRGESGTPVFLGRARARTLDPRAPPPPRPPSSHALAGLTWPLPPGVPPTACAYVWAAVTAAEEEEEGENPALDALRLALAGAPAWASLSTASAPPYSLSTGLPRSSSAAARRRYFLIHKARAASIVGILVTALGDPAVVSEAESLRAAAVAAGKTPYVFVIGRPSPAKLANFPEVDVFVAVADSGPGQLVGGRDWLAPVVTPHEARLAWAQPPPAGEGEEDDAAPVDPLDAWDPTTYRFDEPGEARAVVPAGVAPAEEAFASLALVPRGGRAVAGGSADPSSVAVRTGADFLTTRRTWQGLEAPATGAPAAEAVGVVQGRSGRAAGYEGEG